MWGVHSLGDLVFLASSCSLHYGPLVLPEGRGGTSLAHLEPPSRFCLISMDSVLGPGISGTQQLVWPSQLAV